MKILGIDLSLTATGLALLVSPDEPPVDFGFPSSLFQGNTTVRVWSTTLSTEPSLSGLLPRWLAIVQAIHTWASRADRLVIEGYSFGSMAGQIRLHELGGIVRYELLQRYPSGLLEIPPMTLKRFITGTGGADKNRVMLETYKRWHVEFPNDNECDAHGLAQIGMAYYGSTDNLPQFQQEIVLALLNPKQKVKASSKRTI